MIARLDAVLGRLTMYRLVLVCLGVLVLAALALSAAGVVRPGGADPVAMLASLAVLTAAGLGANALLALAFRVRPHLDSTLITTALLFFILTPRLDLAGLGGLALAGAIAVASKYLLAIRGRHVLNPAAAGAFGIGLTGLAFGTWWVGTPALAPFVAIAAALILFRTRRLPMGGVYVATGLVVGTIQYAAFGQPVLDALAVVVLSSPLLFFAGFMLSEPLTLPPRRWQQLAYAALTAALYYVSYSIGPIYNSPEFALLVGNLLAFLVGQRRGIRLEFAGRRRLSPTAWEFDFSPLRPVRFRPGQFIELAVPHARADGRGSRRVFSIASAPGGMLRVGIRLPERASSFKRALLDLVPGDRIAATAVGGDFVLPADARRPLLLVAGGIGITPFVGQLEQIADEAERRDVVVVYAVPDPGEVAYADRLEAAGCRVVLACSTRPDELPVGWSWIGPERVSAASVLAAVPDAARRHALVSGPPDMVARLARALRRAGVRRVSTDVFVGY